jgi:hypothetical protein
MEQSEVKGSGAGKGRLPRELEYLAVAAIPIGIYILAIAIFELIDFGSMAFESRNAAGLFASKESGARLLFVEGRSRILWLASVLLFYVFAGATLYTGFITLRNSLTSRGFKPALALWALLSATALAHLNYTANNGTALSAIYRFTYESLQSSHRFDAEKLSQIRAVVIVVNILASLAPMAVVLGASATLSPLVDADPARLLTRLARRMRRLKNMVNLGSALLGAGVLHMQSWLNWPIALVGEPKLASAMSDWSLAFTTLVGTIFSLMIASLYIPCQFILARRAELYLRQMPEERVDCTVEEWLEKHGFSLTPAKQIPQVLAMLAPLLAGPVGTALSSVGTSPGQ